METTPFLYYPVKKPINQANLFGADPAYYQQILGTNGHPGDDFECPLYTPIFAPCKMDVFYASDKYGGDGIYGRFPNNANPEGEIIFWHLPPRSDTVHWVIPNGDGVVTSVEVGQLIGYTGNSGYPQESNGPHLHFAVRWLNGPNILNYDNGFHGCVDPLPLFNGKFAQDIATEQQIVNTTGQLVQTVVTAPTSTIPTAQKSAILTFVTSILNWLFQRS